MSPVVGSTAVSGGTALITRNEYKTLAGVEGSAKDDKIDTLIPFVSDAVRKYTDRDFAAAPTTTTRTYRYDGSGYLDIDDVSSITAVTFQPGGSTPSFWTAQPDDTPIYWWLELPSIRQPSPEMGFTRNEDLFGSPLVASVAVTGTFGWPGGTGGVPGEVKMAAVWTLAAWIDNPLPYVSESIEGYSRTQALPAGIRDAIPQRAQSLLDLYQRSPTL